MDKKLKEKWIEALRSGKYQQGVGVLRSATGKYCCLGVLCDVYDQSKWADGAGGFNYDRVATSLPLDLLARSKITDREQNNLITFNDKGQSFEWIAKYIEEYL